MKTGRTLPPEEVAERVKNTPKIDVDALLKQGFRPLEDIFRDIEMQAGRLKRINSKS